MQHRVPFEDLCHWRTQQQPHTENKLRQTLICSWKQKPKTKGGNHSPGSVLWPLRGVAPQDRVTTQRCPPSHTGQGCHSGTPRGQFLQPKGHSKRKRHSPGTLHGTLPVPRSIFNHQPSALRETTPRVRVGPRLNQVGHSPWPHLGKVQKLLWDEVSPCRGALSSGQGAQPFSLLGVSGMGKGCAFPTILTLLLCGPRAKSSSCIMSVHTQGKRIKARKSLEIHHTWWQVREESSRRQNCFCLGPLGKPLCTWCSVDLKRMRWREMKHQYIPHYSSQERQKGEACSDFFDVSSSPSTGGTPAGPGLKAAS